MHVVHHSFAGRFSDNPRAIYEGMLRRERRDGTRCLRHTWVLDPRHASAFPPPPPGVDTVAPDDAGLVTVLESADLLVANTHTEVEWDKPAGTTYLQTWHGTPLKRIHRDVLLAPPGRLDRLDRDVARWDALLSPNAASTPRLRASFRFRGPVWETGYPRNDVLVGPDATAVREATRAELGIDPAEEVVLYAPTWRDDELFTDTDGEIPLRLRLGALVEQLDAGTGGRHRLLWRAHDMVSRRVHGEVAPGVTDVSLHRDPAELYLAADVLVTDYSSVMFDFALTGKPVVFLVDDLDRFRDEIRGFYFDLLPQAPGPVVRSQDELLEALLEHDPERYAQRYAAFRETYGHLEDGHATDRVLALLDELVGPRS